MSIIKLEKVEYSVITKYSELHILKDINLQIKKGEFHIITGPSGSGKTTLLQIIGTILNQTKGRRELFSKDINEKTSEKILNQIRKKIGYLFQSPYLPKHISVIDYVSYKSQLVGEGLFTAENKAKEHLTSLDMAEFIKGKISDLSGGERQRVALAGILTMNVAVLLLDEPTGSLDYTNATKLWDIIKKLNEKGLTIVTVTHDKSIVEIADCIHLLDYGKLKTH
jgi:ABC-type lipoprotein export system ATPase subunit